MLSKTVIFFALVALAAAAPRPDRPSSAYRPPSNSYSPPRPVYSAPDDDSDEDAYSEPAKYDFQWQVDDDDSDNHFGQQESRDGDNTSGSYYVALPDGRTQKVTYYVDGDSGFVAEVSYEGEARYPEPDNSYEAPRPQYSPPRGYN